MLAVQQTLEVQVRSSVTCLTCAVFVILRPKWSLDIGSLQDWHETQLCCRFKRNHLSSCRCLLTLVQDSNGAHTRREDAGRDNLHRLHVVSSAMPGQQAKPSHFSSYAVAAGSPKSSLSPSKRKGWDPSPTSPAKMSYQGAGKNTGEDQACCRPLYTLSNQQKTEYLVSSIMHWQSNADTALWSSYASV